PLRPHRSFFPCVDRLLSSSLRSRPLSLVALCGPPRRRSSALHCRTRLSLSSLRDVAIRDRADGQRNLRPAFLGHFCFTREEGDGGITPGPNAQPVSEVTSLPPAQPSHAGGGIRPRQLLHRLAET